MSSSSAVAATDSSLPAGVPVAMSQRSITVLTITDVRLAEIMLDRRLDSADDCVRIRINEFRGDQVYSLVRFFILNSI